MSLIQLHGLVPGGTQRKPHPKAHQLLDCGAMAALISPVSDKDEFENPTPHFLLKWAELHNDILLAYCADGPVLPMAMGAVFSKKQALRQAIHQDYSTHLKALDRVQDVQEYNVQLRHLTAETRTTASAETGRAFLDAKRAHRNHRKNLRSSQAAFAHDMISRLRSFCFQVGAPASPKPDRLVDRVVLLNKTARPKLSQFAKDLHAKATQLNLDLVVTGPWPPYSFDPQIDPKAACCNDA